jgi:hypothetical protein
MQAPACVIKAAKIAQGQALQTVARFAIVRVLLLQRRNRLKKQMHTAEKDELTS